MGHEMIEHIALIMVAIVAIVLVLALYFDRRQALTKSHLDDVLRQIVRDYGQWAKANNETVRPLARD